MALLLSNLHLPELIAHSVEQYRQIAVQLAEDSHRLAEYRMTLRRRLRQSPLMDAERYARGVENAYREVWGKWCGA